MDEYQQGTLVGACMVVDEVWFRELRELEHVYWACGEGLGVIPMPLVFITLPLLLRMKMLIGRSG